MAKASHLTIGVEYPVTSGKHAGKMVKIIDNAPVPDGQPNQRAILVEIDGQVEYIIPRLIDTGAKQRIAHAGGLDVHSSTPVVEEFYVDAHPIVDPMDPRLDQYRPDASVVKAYVTRTIAGTQMDDVSLLTYFYNDRDRDGYSPNIMLVGETQSGKTMLVQVMAVVIAGLRGYPKPLPVFTLSGSSGVTDFDLFGQPTTYTDERGRERLVWLPGVLDLAARVESILYLDESNMLAERVTSSIHPFTDDRRMFVNRAKAVLVEGSFMPEQVKVNPRTWIIGTYNPGYRGAGAHNEAFSNRFRHLPWDYDAAVERKLITSPAVMLLGDALREARAQRQISTPVGTKALQRLCADAEGLGVEIALWAFLGLFPPQERAKVEAIVTDRSVRSLLMAEASTKVSPS
jgi:MoxR-like ATPase